MHELSAQADDLIAAKFHIVVLQAGCVLHKELRYLLKDLDFGLPLLHLVIDLLDLPQTRRTIDPLGELGARTDTLGEQVKDEQVLVGLGQDIEDVFQALGLKAAGRRPGR